MKLGKIKEWVNKIPEFSDKNFVLASYICAGVVGVVSLFFIYEMFTVDDFGFKVQWNIFKSVFFGPLYFFGLVMAIVWWGKFTHWSATPMIEYEDEWGNKKRKRDWDVSENMFWGILFPILGHFVIEPIIYACLVYYPLAIVFSIVGALLPYILIALLVAITAGFYLSSRHVMGIRFRSVALILAAVLVGGGLLWASVSMEMGKHAGSTDYQSSGPATITVPEDSTAREDADEGAVASENDAAEPTDAEAKGAVCAFDLKGNVASCTWKERYETFTVTFGQDGKISEYNGTAASSAFQKVSYGENGRLTSTEREIPDEFVIATTGYKYAADGQVLEKNVDQSDGHYYSTYTREASTGFIMTAEYESYFPDMGEEDAKPTKGHVTYEYNSVDDHGNWTRRTAKDGEDVWEETRTIKYF